MYFVLALVFDTASTTTDDGEYPRNRNEEITNHKQNISHRSKQAKRPPPHVSGFSAYSSMRFFCDLVNGGMKFVASITGEITFRRKGKVVSHCDKVE